MRELRVLRVRIRLKWGYVQTISSVLFDEIVALPENYVYVCFEDDCAGDIIVVL